MSDIAALMFSDLVGTRVLFVGGGSVGRTTARLALHLGATVAVADVSEEQLTRFRDHVGDVDAYLVNARDDIAIADVLTSAGADHVVLSTGWPLFVRARDFDLVAAIDWIGDRVEPILGIAKWIARNPGRAPRSFTIVSGFVHRRPEPGLALWSLMGPGIVGLAENLAVDLAPTRVNVVGPGPMIDSQMLERAVGSEDAHRKLIETLEASNPSGRAVRLEDTARQVLFVVGDPIIAGSFREVEGGGNLTAGMGFVHD